VNQLKAVEEREAKNGGDCGKTQKSLHHTIRDLRTSLQLEEKKPDIDRIKRSRYREESQAGLVAS
jgi:hypothetical protein